MVCVECNNNGSKIKVWHRDLRDNIESYEEKEEWINYKTFEDRSRFDNHIDDYFVCYYGQY